MDNWEEHFLGSWFNAILSELQAIRTLLEEEKQLRESKLPRSI